MDGMAQRMLLARLLAYRCEEMKICILHINVELIHYPSAASAATVSIVQLPKGRQTRQLASIHSEAPTTTTTTP